MSKSKVSSGQACDGKKLFIEVTGKRQDDELEFIFTNSATHKKIPELSPKEEYEQQDKPATIQGKRINARGIYSWDWSKQTDPVDVHIAMPTKTSVINIPLFNNVTEVERKFHDQDYKLNAIIPLLHLADPYFTPTTPTTPTLLPARQGILYFLYRGKIWREIAVIQTPTEVSFQEVDLNHYRDTTTLSMKVVKNGDITRDITGQAMPCIWLPELEAGKTVNLAVAFSEVQWSAEYINYIETNVDYQNQRFKTLSSSAILPTTDLNDMRLRSEGIEILLDHPEQHNQDLSGQYISNLYKKNKTFEQDLQQNNQTSATYFRQPARTRVRDFAMRSDALRLSLDEKPSKDPDTWQTQPSPNYLAQAKKYYWQALVIDDPLFDFRHSICLIQSGASYLQQLLRDIDRQKYAKVAMAVNSIVMPRMQGEEINPIHKYHKSMDRAYDGIFHRTLRSVERMLTQTDVKQYQTQLMHQITKDRILSALRDITSLNDANACSGVILGSQVLQALSLNMNQLDPYDVNPTNRDSRGQNIALAIMSEDSTHPLHRILFPPKDSVDLSQDSYTSPEAFNDGSGLATLEKIAQYSGDNLDISPKDLVTVEMAAILGEQNNPLYDFSNFRRSTTLAGSILNAFFTALSNVKDMQNEAVKISFSKAYRSISRNLKTYDPQLFGALTLTSSDGLKRTKGFILGFEHVGERAGLSNAQSIGKSLKFGDIYNQENKLVISTNKTRMAKQVGSKKTITQLSDTVEFMVLPEESPLVKELKKVTVQHAIKNVNNSDVNISNSYQKLHIPHFIFIIEIWNLKNAVQYFSSNNPVYSLINITSALFDLSTAGIEIYNVITKNSTKVYSWSSKTVINHGLQTRSFGPYKLVETVSKLSHLMMVGGILTAAISFWDAKRAFDKNDVDAALSATAIGIGVAIITIETKLLTTSATLLGFGPIGWIGIALSIIGGLGYLWFKDNAIEEWLANGPFGGEGSLQNEFSVLNDPEKAYQYWLNTIMGLNVTVYPLKDIEFSSSEIYSQLQEKDITHGVHICSNLPVFIGENSLDMQVRMSKITSKLNQKSGQYNKSKEEIVPLCIPEKETLAIGNGRMYFYTLPKSETIKQPWWSASDMRVDYGLKVRAQIKTTKTTFPLIPLTSLQKNNIVSATPNFDKSPLDGWADEDTYASSKTKIKIDSLN